MTTPPREEEKALGKDEDHGEGVRPDEERIASGAEGEEYKSRLAEVECQAVQRGKGEDVHEGVKADLLAIVDLKERKTEEGGGPEPRGAPGDEATKHKNLERGDERKCHGEEAQRSEGAARNERPGVLHPIVDRCKAQA